MCITSGLCDAGDLFIQVILLLSSPGETPLTYQAASAYLLSFAFNFLVITPTLAILHLYTYYSVETISPPSEVHCRQYTFGGGGQVLHRRPK